MFHYDIWVMILQWVYSWRFLFFAGQSWGNNYGWSRLRPPRERLGHRHRCRHRRRPTTTDSWYRACRHTLTLPTPTLPPASVVWPPPQQHQVTATTTNTTKITTTTAQRWKSRRTCTAASQHCSRAWCSDALSGWRSQCCFSWKTGA